MTAVRSLAHWNFIVTLRLQAPYHMRKFLTTCPGVVCNCRGLSAISGGGGMAHTACFLTFSLTGALLHNTNYVFHYFTTLAGDDRHEVIAATTAHKVGDGRPHSARLCEEPRGFYNAATLGPMRVKSATHDESRGQSATHDDGAGSGHDTQRATEVLLRSPSRTSPRQ